MEQEFDNATDWHEDPDCCCSSGEDSVDLGGGGSCLGYLATVGQGGAGGDPSASYCSAPASFDFDTSALTVQPDTVMPASEFVPSWSGVFLNALMIVVVVVGLLKLVDALQEIERGR